MNVFTFFPLALFHWNIELGPCQSYQTSESQIARPLPQHEIFSSSIFDDKPNTSRLQSMTSTREDMMETLNETEQTFNDTEQRLNRKIINIFRVTTDPNFLMKSFQSNGSFQQILPSEGKGIFQLIQRLKTKDNLILFRSRPVSDISSALLCADLLCVCHSFRKYFNLFLTCLH